MDYKQQLEDSIDMVDSVRRSVARNERDRIKMILKGMELREEIETDTLELINAAINEGVE